MKKHLLKNFGKMFLVCFITGVTSAFAQTNDDLTRGKNLLEAGGYAEAIAALTKCATADEIAIRSECLQTRALAFGGNGEREKALADFAAAIKLAPHDARGYFARARYFIGGEDLNNALPDFDQTLRLDPQNAEAFFYRGQIHSESGEKLKAISDFSAAVKLDPAYHQAFLLRAFDYMQTENFDAAIADFTAYIKLQPADAEGHWQRAKAFRKTGDKQKAKTDFEAALEIEPDSVIAREGLKNLNLTKEEVVQKAGELQKNENPLAALDFVTDYPEFADEVEILYLKSVGYVDAGDFKKADAAFQRQFEKFLENAAESRKMAEDLVKENPANKENTDLAVLMYSAAMVSYGSADLVNAVRATAFEKAGIAPARHSPKNLAGYNEMLKYYEQTALANADLLFKSRQFADALANYKKAIELNPKNAAAFYGRAKVYRAQRKLKLAAADEATARRLSAAR